jgi:hypothetical protein
MSYKASAWAVEQRVGDPTAKLLLLTLAEAAGIDAPECWPKRKTLADRIEASEDTVDRKLKQLASLGLVTIQKRKAADGNLPNIYRLNIERGPQIAGTSPQIAGTLPAQPCGDTSPHSSAAQKGHGETSLNPSGVAPVPGASQEPPKGGEHRAFFELWHTAFLENFGDRYAFTARDAATVKRLLKSTERPADELVAIARQAWAASSDRRRAFACGSAASIAGFAAGYNRILTELKGLGRIEAPSATTVEPGVREGLG